MRTNEYWLVLLLSALLDGCFNLGLMRVVTGRAPKRALLPFALLYHVLTAALINLDWLTPLMGLSTPLNLIAFAAMIRWIFGLRKKAFWLSFLCFEIALIVSSLLAARLSIRFISMASLSNEALMSPLTLLETNLCYWVAAALVGAVVLLFQKIRRKNRHNPAFWSILRLSLSVALIGVFLYARNLLSVYLDGLDLAKESPEYVAYNFLFLVGMTVPALLLTLSLIYQDIRTIIQVRRNETLAEKQATINELLVSMRGFRHNIGNLLYGMEGAMLADDLSEARAYYQQLVEKCTLMNSENVLAVQNLAVPSVAALLLRKLDAASEAGIPMYLYVEPHVTVRLLSGSDLCEIIGVLLDNALEAAKESPAPYVSLELRQLAHETELVVRNTAAGRVEPALFTRNTTKTGHEGVGILRAQQLLSKRAGAYLNYAVAGRYVEAQVLLG